MTAHNQPNDIPSLPTTQDEKTATARARRITVLECPDMVIAANAEGLASRARARDTLCPRLLVVMPVSGLRQYFKAGRTGASAAET